MKFFSKIMMLAAIAGLFCSCEKEGKNGDSTAPKEVVMSYSYTNTADFFELMNVHVEYINKDGSLIKEPITKNWSYNATVPYATAPKDYKFVITYSAASQNLEQTKDKYTIQGSFTANVHMVLANGETKNVGREAITEQTAKTWTGENINSYLGLHKDVLTLSFNASLEEK